MRTIYQSITGRLCIISVIAFILEPSKTTVNAVSIQSNKNEKRDNLRGKDFYQEVFEKQNITHTHQKSLNKALDIIDMGHLDSNYEHLRILANNRAAEMEVVRDINKKKSISSYKFKKFAAHQILRMLTKNCRRTNNWVCGSHGTPLKKECGDFCVPGTPQCFAFVADIAFDVFNILFTFVPFSKVYYGVRAALKAGSKSIKAGAHVFSTSIKEAAQDMFMNVKNLFDEEKWAMAFIENVAFGQQGLASYAVDNATGVFLDIALREVTEILTYIQMTKYMDEEMLEKFKKESKGKKDNINYIGTYQHVKLFDDSLKTREDEWGAVKNVLADMDPTGVVSIVNKFTGPECTKEKDGVLAPAIVCIFDEEVLESKADDLCCSLASEKLGSYPQIKEGKETMVKKCNLPNGDDSCDEIPGVKIRAHYTTFIDGSLDFNRHDIGGSTKGMYFIISNDLQSDWNKYFPKFSEHKFCDMFEEIQYRECASAKYGFGESEEDCMEKDACSGTRLLCLVTFQSLYLQNCMEPLGYEFNLEVKQCRRGVKIWQGNIIMYKGKFEGKNMDWHGRRFANDLEDNEWETGDTIIPHDTCCSKNLDDYIIPMKTLGKCGNNPDWETGMRGCDWIAQRPLYRCSMENPFEISARVACKGACHKDCRQVAPNGEPESGVRVDGFANWGHAKGTYFLVYEGWPTVEWEKLGFPMDIKNNRDRNVLDVQQFRGSKNQYPFRKGPIEIFKDQGRIFGRWKEGYRPSDWLEGDVILPFGEDWTHWEARHGNDKRSKPYETLAPVTPPPTNAPITPRSYGFIVQAGKKSPESFLILASQKQHFEDVISSKIVKRSENIVEAYVKQCRNGREINDVCIIEADMNTLTGKGNIWCKPFLTGDVLIRYTTTSRCDTLNFESVSVSESPTVTPNAEPSIILPDLSDSDWLMTYGKGTFEQIDQNPALWNADSENTKQNGRWDDPSFYIRRLCYDCVKSHRDIIYKRLTEVPSGMDLQDLFLANWFDKNNNLGVDFKLYSTFEDAQNDTNEWKFCNYNDPGIGFPRDCGSVSRVGGQWNSLTRGGKNDISYYVWDKNPTIGTLLPENPHGLHFNIGIEVEAEEATSKFRIPENNWPMWWKIRASYGHKLRQCRNGKKVWEGFFYINSLYIGRYDSDPREEGDWQCGDIIIREHENCEKTQHELNKGNTVSCPTEAPTEAPRNYGMIIEAVEGSQLSFAIPFQERQYWNINAQSKLGNIYHFSRCSNGEMINKYCEVIFDHDTWTGQSQNGCNFLTGDVLIGYVVDWTCEGAVQSTAISKAPTKNPTKAPVATTSSPTKAPITTTSSSSGYMFYTVGKDGEDCNAACEAIGKQCDRSSIKTTTEEVFRLKLKLAEVPFVGTIIDYRSPNAECPLLVEGNLWVLNAESGNPTCSGGGTGLERLCTCK